MGALRDCRIMMIYEPMKFAVLCTKTSPIRAGWNIMRVQLHDKEIPILICSL